MSGWSPRPSNIESGTSRVEEDPQLANGRPHSPRKGLESHSLQVTLPAISSVVSLASTSREEGTRRPPETPEGRWFHKEKGHDSQVPLHGGLASPVNRGKIIPPGPTTDIELNFTPRGKKWITGPPVFVTDKSKAGWSSGKTTATKVPMWRHGEHFTYDAFSNSGWNRKAPTFNEQGQRMSNNTESKRHFENELFLHNRKQWVPVTSELMRVNQVPMNPAEVAKVDSHGRWIDYSGRAYGGPFAERMPRTYDTEALLPEPTSELLSRGGMRNTLTMPQAVNAGRARTAGARTRSKLSDSLNMDNGFVLVPRGAGKQEGQEGVAAGSSVFVPAAGPARPGEDAAGFPSGAPVPSTVKLGRSAIAAGQLGQESKVESSLLQSYTNSSLETGSIEVLQPANPQLEPHNTRLSGRARHVRSNQPDVRFDSSIQTANVEALPPGTLQRDVPGQSMGSAMNSVSNEDSVTGLYGTLGTIGPSVDPAGYPTAAVIPHPDVYLARKGRVVQTASVAGARSTVMFPTTDGSPSIPSADTLSVPDNTGAAVRDKLARAGKLQGPGAVPRPMTVAEIRTASMPLVGGGRAVRDLLTSPYGLIDESTYVRTDPETLAPRAVRRSMDATGANLLHLTASQAAFEHTANGSYLEPSYERRPGQVAPAARPASIHKALRRHAGMREGGDGIGVPKPGTAPPTVTGAAPGPVPGFESQRLRIQTPMDSTQATQAALEKHQQHLEATAKAAAAGAGEMDGSSSGGVVSPMRRSSSAGALNFQPNPTPDQLAAAGVPTELAPQTSRVPRVAYTDIHHPTVLLNTGRATVTALGRAQAQSDAREAERERYERTMVIEGDKTERRSRSTSSPTSKDRSVAFTGPAVVPPADLESMVGARPPGLLDTDVHKDRHAWIRTSLGRDSLREAVYGIERAYEPDMIGKQVYPPPFPMPGHLDLPFYVHSWQERETAARPAIKPTPAEPYPPMVTVQPVAGVPHTLQGGATMHGYSYHGHPPASGGTLYTPRGMHTVGGSAPTQAGSVTQGAVHQGTLMPHTPLARGASPFTKPERLQSPGVSQILHNSIGGPQPGQGYTQRPVSVGAPPMATGTVSLGNPPGAVQPVVAGAPAGLNSGYFGGFHETSSNYPAGAQRPITPTAGMISVGLNGPSLTDPDPYRPPSRASSRGKRFVPGMREHNSYGVTASLTLTPRGAQPVQDVADQPTASPTPRASPPPTASGESRPAGLGTGNFGIGQATYGANFGGLRVSPMGEGPSVDFTVPGQAAGPGQGLAQTSSMFEAPSSPRPASRAVTPGGTARGLGPMPSLMSIDAPISMSSVAHGEFLPSPRATSRGHRPDTSGSIGFGPTTPTGTTLRLPGGPAAYINAGNQAPIRTYDSMIESLRREVTARHGIAGPGYAQGSMTLRATG